MAHFEAMWCCCWTAQFLTDWFLKSIYVRRHKTQNNFFLKSENSPMNLLNSVKSQCGKLSGFGPSVMNMAVNINTCLQETSTPSVHYILCVVTQVLKITQVQANVFRQLVECIMVSRVCRCVCSVCSLVTAVLLFTHCWKASDCLITLVWINMCVCAFTCW